MSKPLLQACCCTASHLDSQAAASEPSLTSVLSHRVCMEIAFLRRLRRSRCLQACSLHRGCTTISTPRWLSPSRCLQACSRTASAWGFRSSGGCVGAVSDECVVAPRLHGDCDSQAATSKSLRAYCHTASVWRLRLSGGCVEAVAHKRLVCAPRRFKFDGCRANFFASFDPLGGPWSWVCMPREGEEGQQWPRRCWG